MRTASFSIPHAAALRPRETAYVLGHDGFIYAGHDLSSGVTSRHSAAILLSADHRAVTVTSPDGTRFSGPALLVPPLVPRRLDAAGVALLSINVMPSHRAFHVFAARQHAGVQPLHRELYFAWDADLRGLVKGELDLDTAGTLFEHLVDLACSQLPPAPPQDPAAGLLIQLLDDNPCCTIDELARKLGRPPRAVSRLFPLALGMSARDYQGWLRMRRMMELMDSARSLTDVALDAGFSDSPQFSRTYLRWYGRPPSTTRDPSRVRVLVRRPPKP
ncbi:helix-turn-helix transcriptional regulator [Piscinibacter sp. HJYY11]|uniref:helix-turn-helix transcriptional regulator n=1 Tax=Piscinibacter sp. HJYY11 TaxID=2801333 RepID=UPI00191E8F32|nr:helix-turn-helix transcriptional regulator [Piscinibacter sp. HJYY11]MBL0728036.1 helix-turn-helix transcriptional regulator [Piscinibacter sp. HJYY11]